jgi:hypothetical protein
VHVLTRIAVLLSLTGAVAHADEDGHSARWVDVSPNASLVPKGRPDFVARAVTVEDLPEFAVAFEIGAASPISDTLGTAVAARVAVRQAAATGWELSVIVDSAHEDRLRETSGLFFAGYRLGVSAGRFRAWGGLDAGGGFISQTGGISASTGALALAPRGGVSLQVSRDVDIVLEGTVVGELLRKDSETTTTTVPAAFVGVVVAP